MENLKCLFHNFPWDVFIFFFLVAIILFMVLNWLINRKHNPRLLNHEDEVKELSDEIKRLEAENKALSEKDSSLKQGYHDKLQDLRVEYESRIGKLVSELQICQRQRSDFESTIERLEEEKKESLSSAPESIVSAPVISESSTQESSTSMLPDFGPMAASSSPSQTDDLKVIDGIGPKIEELFNAAGIYRYEDLAAADPLRLRNILDAGGPRFYMHEPGTWPRQAAMARDGKWEELKAWQATLDGGKETE